jgi:hypothetical protein
LILRPQLQKSQEKEEKQQKTAMHKQNDRENQVTIKKKP